MSAGRCEDCGIPLDRHGNDCGYYADEAYGNPEYGRPAGWLNAGTGEFTPAGEPLPPPPCPRCQCCTLRLCELAAQAGVTCQQYAIPADVKAFVAGCPCTAGGAR